ncbi:MAG: metal-sensitive transcriptional regulator [Candidatus Omnitrophica bacterium]|nr:metal-sensitive transcriptional regulator [Candidatus Omnitrophota bacterium]
MAQPPKHTDSLKRLRKVEGQIQGIQRMLATQRYCIDVLQQITAARRALDEVSLQIMRGHINSCVSSAIRSGDGAEKVEELMRAIHRFVK